MYEADKQLGIDPLAFEPVVTVPAATVVAEPFRIEPADWDQEARERAEREKAERVAEAAALLEPAEEPAKPTALAAKQSRWHRTETA